MATARFEVQGTVDPRIVNGFMLPIAAYPAINNGLRGYHKIEPASIAGDKLVNLAAPASPATIVGSPIVEADGLTFTGLSAFLQTLNAETPDQTFMTLGRAAEISSALRPYIMGNYNTSPSPARGVGLYVDGLPSGQASPQGAVKISNATSADGGTTVSLQTATSNSVDVMAWECLAVAWRAGTGATFYNLTKGTTVSINSPNPRAVGASLIRIGSAYVNYVGRWKGRRVADWSRALTKGEIDAVRTFWQAELAASAAPISGF